MYQPFDFYRWLSFNGWRYLNETSVQYIVCRPCEYERDRALARARARNISTTLCRQFIIIIIFIICSLMSSKKIIICALACIRGYVRDCLVWSSSDDKWHDSEYMRMPFFQRNSIQFVTCAIVRYSHQLRQYSERRACSIAMKTRCEK